VAAEFGSQGYLLVMTIQARSDPTRHSCKVAWPICLVKAFLSLQRGAPPGRSLFLLSAPRQQRASDFSKVFGDPSDQGGRDHTSLKAKTEDFVRICMYIDIFVYVCVGIFI
jgi:hypothetical protein